MEVMCNNYIPGDSRLIEKLVSELKSQGIFDQFRKECISDVDTKPAYQNLRQRVEGSVTAFLKQQTWSIDLNKNQLREQLRKNLYESGFLETGVERIVDQVVNPKISTVFLPKVEEVVYKFLGVDKPVRNVKKEVDVSITDLLPTDLEAVSPESVHSFKTGSKKDNDILNSTLPSSNKMEEDESPPFEPIDENAENNLAHSEKMIVDENTRDSHLSGFSGLDSHDSNPGSSDNRCYQMELSNQDSQGSQISSESHLSIVTSEDTTKMEVCEDSNVEKSEEVIEDETEIKIKSDNIETKNEESKQAENENNEIKKEAEKKFDKEDRKSRTSEKYSKDKKDDKQRKSSSSSKDKDKSSSKSSSQSKNKESRDKDRKDSKSASSKDKDKDKTKDKDKEKSDKEKSSKKSDKEKYKNDKERSDKDKARPDKTKLEKETANKIEKEKTEKERSKDRSDKNKSEKDKSKSETDKSKLEKDKSNREKDKSAKDKSREKSLKTKEKSDKTSKDKSHRDRSSSSKDTKESKDKTKEESKEKSKSSSSSSKHGSSKEKKPSTPKKESSYQSKDKSSSSGSAGYSKSKTPTEKSKKDEPTDKYSSNKKDKQKDSKKKSKDDHYSSKLNKTDRRSTDRDSNDGQSSKNYSNSYSESSRSENNSQDYTSSTSFTGGSGDSSNSDQLVIANSEENKASEEVNTATVPEVPKVKYMKPKFALNFEEARKIMKIRKQLAILEKQNKLSLAKIELPLPLENGIKKKTVTINKMEDDQKLDISEEKENVETSKQDKETTSQEDSLVSSIESTDLSKENWEALEAKLAQVMAEVDCNSYESDEDFEFHGYSSVDVAPKHLIDLSMDLVKKTEMEMLNKQITNQNNKENVGDLPNTNETKNKSSGSSPKVQVVDEENVTANGNKTKNGMTEHKSRIYRQLSVVLNKTARDTNEDACYYLDKPTENEEHGLRFIQKLISKLDEEVDCTVRYSRENAKGKKRKFEEAVDVKNNNKTNYMETVKKRTVSASFQSVKAVANKKRMCSTDITASEVFPLPLSPAESDKSNERKDEDLLIPIKQKRIVRGYSQRYSSEDLYKPRPTIGGRRSKLARGNV